MWQRQTVSSEEFETKPRNCCACGSKTKLLHVVLYALTIIALLTTALLHLLASEYGRRNLLQALTDCFIDKNGEDYGGTRTVTRTGKPCQEWIKNTPHQHDYAENATFREGSAAAAANYCRNPKSSIVGIRDRPWCFTTDPTKRWEYCSAVKNVCNAIFFEASEKLFCEKSTLFYPAPWAVVAVWTIAYVWLLLGLVFALVIASARDAEAWNEFGHRHPDVLPWPLTLTVVLILALQVAWIFLWDREYEQVSFAFSLFAAFVAFAAAFAKTWQYRKTKDESIEERGPKQYTAYHCFLENGLVALVTALTFFSMTYFTVVMKTKQVLSDEIGAVIALSILLNFYVLWIIFDLIVMANAMRYVFSPQLILSLCLVGIATRKWEDDLRPTCRVDNDSAKKNSAPMIFTAAFLCVIFITTAAKIIVTWVQRRRMNEERRRMESLAGAASASPVSSAFDSFETAKTINKLLYGSTSEYAGSYRQNDVLY